MDGKANQLEFFVEPVLPTSFVVTWTFGVIDFSKKVPCGHLG